MNGFSRAHKKGLTNSNGCPVCRGSGYFEAMDAILCTFCNGTKEWTRAADSFMKAHPCQCVNHDRKNCPLCGSTCHHSTSNKPRLMVIQPPP